MLYLNYSCIKTYQRSCASRPAPPPRRMRRRAGPFSCLAQRPLVSSWPNGLTGLGPTESAFAFPGLRGGEIRRRFEGQ